MHRLLANGKDRKRIKGWNSLDEITSASLTSLWLHRSPMSAAQCHWISIEHTCDVNSAIFFTPFTALSMTL